MPITFKRTATAICAIVAASFAVTPPAPAEAQTLLDLIRGGPGRAAESQRIREDLRQRELIDSREAERSDPEPVVAGPRYYTYKADGLRAISVAAIADPVVTGSIDGAPSSAADAFSTAIAAFGDRPVEALEDVAGAVEAYYADEPSFIWLDARGPNARANAVIDVLKSADAVGLRASDYAVEPLDLTGSDVDEAGERMRFELALSSAVLTYALDATRGRIDPNRISGYHDFQRKTLDLKTALTVIARTGDPAGYLEARSPRHDTFKALMAERARLLEAEDGERIDIPADTFLRPGETSDELADIVAAIRAKGSDGLKTDHALTFADYDGGSTYTPELVALVEAFQGESGLQTDGIIGANTIRAMVDLSNADKLEKVDLAMERLRWMRRDLGDRHVLINAAAYRATYTENGEDALSMRVVVGTKANQTYFFEDEIETVEFNPYWGVPRSIIVNEMLPELRRDPSYLDRQGYEVTTQSGQRVASSSVDWYSVGANPGYNVRQPPGGSNALGELKILFPNAHAIYMHDTPAKNLFSRDSRAYSHGCVRLEDPRAMAAAVLGTTRDDIGSQIADGQNKAVSVDADIPVYVAYFTAWPSADGTIEYFGDIYDRDDYLARAMDATDAVRGAES